MRLSTKIQLGVIGGSLVAHLIGWACVGLISKEHKHDTIAISLSDSKKKEKEKEKEKPKPPPVEVKPEKAKIVQPVAKAEPPPQVTDAPPPTNDAPASNMNGFADLGLSMSGGGGGVAVPMGGGGGGGQQRQAPTAPTATERKVVQLGARESECAEELVKAKLERQTQPSYTQEGRQANIEGVVRLELTIDTTGHVVGVKVLRGLGYGLDEAAVSEARKWTFTPATRCGKPVPSTVKGTVPFRLT